MRDDVLLVKTWSQWTSEHLFGLKFSRFMLNLISYGFIFIATLLILGLVFILVNIPMNVYTWLDIDADTFLTAVVITACILVVVAVSGGIVAATESVRVANIYRLVLLILFVAEFNVIIALSITRPNFFPKVEYNMLQSLQGPLDDWSMQGWHWLHEELGCCGITGYNDWASYNITGVNYADHFQRTNTITVPYSCCGKISAASCEHVHNTGCGHTLWTSMEVIAIIFIGIFATATILLEIFGLNFASLHIKNIIRLKTRAEMKKQEWVHLLHGKEEAQAEKIREQEAEKPPAEKLPELKF